MKELMELFAKEAEEVQIEQSPEKTEMRPERSSSRVKVRRLNLKRPGSSLTRGRDLSEQSRDASFGRSIDQFSHSDVRLAEN